MVHKQYICIFVIGAVFTTYFNSVFVVETGSPVIKASNIEFESRLVKRCDIDDNCQKFKILKTDLDYSFAGMSFHGQTITECPATDQECVDKNKDVWKNVSFYHCRDLSSSIFGSFETEVSLEKCDFWYGLHIMFTVGVTLVVACMFFFMVSVVVFDCVRKLYNVMKPKMLGLIRKITTKWRVMKQPFNPVDNPFDVQSCPICLTDYQRGCQKVVFKCYHSVCQNCFRQLLQRDQGWSFSCPTCQDKPFHLVQHRWLPNFHLSLLVKQHHIQFHLQ